MADRTTTLQGWLDLVAFLVGHRPPVSVEKIMEGVPVFAEDWADGSDTDRTSVLEPSSRTRTNCGDPDRPRERHRADCFRGRARVDPARAGASGETSAALLDWLRVEFGVEKEGKKLSAPHQIDSDTLVAEVKKRRTGASTVSATELRRLREEFDRTVAPLREGEERAAALERQISDAVNAAYGLTPDEVDLLWRTAPPRMPPVDRNCAGPAAAEAA